MALTRKFLSALGIEADKVDEIIEAHAETVNGLKAERDEYKGSAEKLESVQKELKEAQEQLNEAGKDSFKEKYDAVKEEFETFKANTEKKAIEEAKDKAYRAMLAEAGVSEKRIDAVMKVTDLSHVEIDEEGLKDADKLKDSIKEEWADFITSSNKEGANTDTPPESNGDEHTAPAVPTIF